MYAVLVPAPGPVPERCREGVALFHAGEYFQAHEVLEDVWREAAPEDRKFFQGLIQIAVALHHHSRGNATGCRSLLARASRNLSLFPEKHYGLELAELLQALRSWQQALENHEPVPAPPRIRFS
jgi:uncharacterized protein